jgi:hypothetical protein
MILRPNRFSFRLLLLTATTCSWIVGIAQDSTSARYTSGQIVQSYEISSLLNRYDEFNKKRDITEGYRIQITYSDIREDIYKSKSALYHQFPDVGSYVEYEQPYFKLRLGDFATRLEATYYLQQTIALYPGAFIVKDKIKTKKDN